MPAPSNHPFEMSRGRYVAIVTGAYALLGGVSSFLGYVLDMPRLTDWPGYGISIQPNAAICVAGSGGGLCLLALGYKRAAGALGLIVALIGAVTFLEYITPLRTSIHGLLLFGREWGRAGVIVPGRMGPPGALSWTLIGTALVLASLPQNPARTRRVVPILAIITFTLSATSICGYLYGVSMLYSVPKLTVIAIQTATFILALSIGLLSVVPEHGIISVLRRNDPGGLLLRRMLVPVIVLPLLIGWLRVRGQEWGYYDTGFGSASTALLMIVILAMLVTISARRVSQAASVITEQAERLRTTLASIGDAVISTDVDGRVTMLNPVAEHLTGWTNADARGRPLEEVFRIVNESSRLTVENPCVRALRDGVIVGLANHTVLLARDGKEHPIDDSAAPIRTAAGEIVGCVLIFRDITTRRAQEQALRDREQRLAGILDSVTDGFSTVDKDWRFTFINDNLVQRFGRPREQIIGQNLWEMFPDAIGTEAHTQLQRAMQDRVRVEYEIHYEPFEKWLYDKVAPTADGGLAIYSADITPRKLIENQLRRSAELLRVIIDRSPSGFYIVDADFRISHINAESQNRAFRNVNPAIGRRLDDAMRILWPEPVASEVIAIFRHTLETGEPYKSPGLVSPRADLEQVESYEWQLERITLVDGRFGVVCYYYDTTQLRETERALEMAREAAEAANVAKDNFLATLSHELRNPLAPVTNSLEILKRAADRPDLVEKARQTMHRQVSHLVRLVDDLLDVSRISQGKLTLRKERVELATIINHAIESCRPLADGFEHELEVSIPSEPVVLNADPVRLTQVVGNLLNNACKYTPLGGKISLISEFRNGEVIIRIRDTGHGIPKEMLQKIFEPFAQVHQNLEATRSGLGIGLALVKRLVELHGGTVEAHSDGPNRGSEFIVRLPTGVEHVTSHEPARAR